MALYYNKNNIEVGIDEVARGCLAGPVYAAAVIWPNDEEFLDKNIKLKDSKKISKKRREELQLYIEETALDFGIGIASAQEIDKLNIRNATMLAMHRALEKLNIEPDMILVDGDFFKPYFIDNDVVPYQCVIKGDSKYQSISAASILAKVYHDKYIEKICEENTDLQEYGWLNNMCYGTNQHIETIKKKG